MVYLVHRAKSLHEAPEEIKANVVPRVNEADLVFLAWWVTMHQYHWYHLAHQV